MTPGTYAYRFSGYTVDVNGDGYSLTGVGVLVLAAGGAITGEQSSSITLLQGQGAKLMRAKYTITGSYAGGEGDIGQATLKFASTAQDLTGTFDFVAAGPDRMWLISTGAQLTAVNGRQLNPPQDADEVVSGEAVRVG